MAYYAKYNFSHDDYEAKVGDKYDGPDAELLLLKGLIEARPDEAVKAEASEVEQEEKKGKGKGKKP